MFLLACRSCKTQDTAEITSLYPSMPMSECGLKEYQWLGAEKMGAIVRSSKQDDFSFSLQNLRMFSAILWESTSRTNTFCWKTGLKCSGQSKKIKTQRYILHWENDNSLWKITIMQAVFNFLKLRSIIGTSQQTKRTLAFCTQCDFLWLRPTSRKFKHRSDHLSKPSMEKSFFDLCLFSLCSLFNDNASSLS